MPILKDEQEQPTTMDPAPSNPTGETQTVSQEDVGTLTAADLAALEIAVDPAATRVEFRSRQPELRVLFGLDDNDVYQFHGGRLSVSEADAKRLQTHKFYLEEHFFLAKDVVSTADGTEAVHKLPEIAAKWRDEGLTVYALPGVNTKLTLVLKTGAMVDVQFEDGYAAVRSPEVCEAMAAHLFAIQGRMFRVNKGDYDPVEPVI